MENFKNIQKIISDKINSDRNTGKFDIKAYLLSVFTLRWNLMRQWNYAQKRYILQFSGGVKLACTS